MKTPIVWSISGQDSGGGAGLSADQRAADAAEVHLCPIVAALTAQSSVAVESVHPVPPEQLHAQLEALADDLAPRALKTGLLGSVANVRVVAQWVDRLRQRGPLALVVDPVLRASTGESFANVALVEAYRRELLPRATFVTPNRREAARLLLRHDHDVPDQARDLRALGTEAVCITGGDAEEPAARDHWHSAHATGWLTLPRRTASNTHGTGCTFATALAAAIARGFVPADAAVIAKMLTTSGLHPDALNPGRGAGPVRPHHGFITDRSLLPTLSDDEPLAPPPGTAAPVQGLYAITDHAAHVETLVEHGVRTVQLRLKRTEGEPDAAWQARLLGQISHARAAALAHGATLIVNDHWQQAAALGVDFVHLGQEDLLALGHEERDQLARARAAGLRLGLSSHSLWELARAAAWQPDYIACGPVWPTLTKAMPWRPQGLHNLAWWAAMSPAPVVAIGGILAPEQLTAVARAGASAGCVVRGLQADSPYTASTWLEAWQHGAGTRPGAIGWPQPSLDAA
ncbi:PfkB family carbohydrate kinase [Piscinibacter sp. HJYY11]|uniref:PfkB family carbohydrate kinase n=1 Tax=Piscinibacter sp. HJYY11 TaxID=2801333 RepID=UPI00191CEEBE|nr:PfkB family carbohydrate kinase [Piscinibacter sp. HJYY11]MBL0730089.1 bifunctional hydroxymethylpyrimidine kinase/phosphomethylpyrimidine kinase [Piscinibacter sp. HJYY11]